ncbi:MAG: hypothetical protein J4F41_06335, partial [Alphaproteobacteria bacterium]|nr:hypothetical protein [Alphaproteobacteria bacterium]
MATPDKIPTDLTIDLGDNLSPKDFISAVQNFIGYVDEITESEKSNNVEVNWTIRVREGSALIGVEPDIGTPSSHESAIYEKFHNVTSAITNGNIYEAEISEKAIGHLKSLSKLSIKYSDGNGINLWIEKKRFKIKEEISSNIIDDKPKKYHDYGTIEGRLESIKDSTGKLKISIKDVLYPKP